MEEKEVFMKCNQCGKEFSKADQLLAHKFLHDLDKPKHTCPNCNTFFQNYNKLQEHIVTHRTPFPCKICPEQFSSQTDMYRHMLSLHSVTQLYQCILCSWDMNPKFDEIEQHEQNVHPELFQDRTTCDQDVETAVNEISDEVEDTKADIVKVEDINAHFEKLDDITNEIASNNDIESLDLLKEEPMETLTFQEEEEIDFPEADDDGSNDGVNDDVNDEVANGASSDENYQPNDDASSDEDYYPPENSAMDTGDSKDVKEKEKDRTDEALEKVDFGEFIEESTVNVGRASTRKSRPKEKVLDTNDKESSDTIPYAGVEGRYKCKVCQKPFQHRNSLRSHEFLHTKEEDIPCPVPLCKSRLKSKSNLLKHIRKTHPDENVNEKTLKYVPKDKVHVEKNEDNNQKENGDEENDDSMDDDGKYRPYKCKYCDERFTLKHNCVVHEKRHENKTLHYCTECTESFTKFKDLKKHMESQHPGSIIPRVGHWSKKGKFHCKYCGKPFGYSQNCRMHERKHTGVSAIECQYCDKVYHRRDEMVNHYKQKHPGQEYDLPASEKAPKTNYRYNEDGVPTRINYKVNENGEKIRTFQCSLCLKMFYDVSALRMHERRHDKSRKTFQCSFCSKMFFNASSLRVHEKRHKGERDYQCQYCDEKFVTKVAKKDHEAKHEMRTVCPTCGKLLSSPHALQVHMYVHTKPFICHVCGKGCSSRRYLEKHEKSHDPEKQAEEEAKKFQCSFCGYSTPSQVDLTGHVKTVHKGEKPFVCKECGQGFTRATNLREHQLMHSVGKAYHCRVCQSQFIFRTGLRTHYKKYHPESADELIKNIPKFDLRKVTTEFVAKNDMDFSLELKS